MDAFKRFKSRLLPLAVDNVDTDQIIPARFLKTTDKKGLGKVLFYDWRYDAAGSPRQDFILNDSRWAGCEILLAGNNFGCGSSREHAPWALADYGFRAIISTAFADIFRNNCLKNGLLPILVGKPEHEMLFAEANSNPESEFEVDLGNQSLALPRGGTIHFPIDPFSKKCLLDGIDELGYLLKRMGVIESYESARGSD